MTVETALYPSELNASWPAQSDIVREGAGHIRAVKTVLKTTFPNVTGAVSPTQIELNHMVGVTSGVQSQINAKGAIAGQTWTGTHVFPSTTTVGPLTPTIQGYLSTITSDAQAQINGKGSIAGQAWTGVHNFGGSSSVALPADTSIGSVSATELSYLDGVTAPIQGQLSGKADTNGEIYIGAHDFTGATITAPTKPTGTSSNEVATTAFVAATALSAALPGQAGNAGKLLTTDGMNASWRLFGTLAEYGITDAVEKTKALGNADLNTVVASGFYSFATPTNGPSGVTGSQLIVSRGGDTATQIVVDKITGSMFVRAGSALGTVLVWSAWRRTAMHSDVVVPAVAGAMDCSAGNYFTAAIAGATTLSFTNIPEGSYSAVLEINYTSGAVTMPSGTVWAGAAPVLTAGRWLIFFQRAQVGTAGWYASSLGKYAA